MQKNKIMKASKWLSKKSEKYLAEARADFGAARCFVGFCDVGRLARATGDKTIISSFSEANSLHRNFYENELI